MLSGGDLPDDQYWMNVGSDGRRHPYLMHRLVNRNTVEVVSSVSDPDSSPRRWVLVRDSAHEVWVKGADRDEYGYGLQPAERVSEAELDAIALKHAAVRDGAAVSVTEARELVTAGQPEQVRHGLVALYYAAKADPEIPEAAVDGLRELVHERTGHVDTSHVPTILHILEDVDSTAP